MKILLTDRGLRAMKPASPGTRKTIWDSAVPNFGVRVTDKGKASFFIMRRLHRKLVRRTLGQFPVMTLAQAREAALDALRDISAGVDPKDKQEASARAEARRRADSFASVAEEFIARHVRKLRSRTQVEGAIRRELLHRWGAKPITEVTRRDVIRALEEIADSGRPAAAHKVFGCASKLFGWAISRDVYGLEISPCAGIRTSEVVGRKEARQRVLTDAEIRAVWTAAESLGYPAGPFIQMLLISGQRLQEVSGMRWSEVDLDKALWTIPPERMKSDAAEIPLPPVAVDLLRGLPRFAGPCVFTTTAGAVAMSGFSKLKLRIDAAIADLSPTGDKLDPWRFHDCRRTMRTGLGALPVPSNVAEMVIGHAQPGLHQVYDRHTYRDEKRWALELWAARLREIVAPDSGDNVVRLRRDSAE